MAINYGKLNAKLTPRGSLKATMGVSGPLNSDYEALINKPQINGNELIGDKSNADLGIPTALEDLTDDSTHRVVTDEQIDAWDNKSDFSGSYDDLTDKPTIPDELADLTDDSTHRLVTDTEKTTWNAKSDFSGSYNDLTDVPANLVQDANYVHTDNNYDNTAKGKVDALGTASTKNVPESGDASTSEVVLGNDTRLTDDRNAKDVYSWAKASTKPEYTATEVGAIASTLKGTANGVAELDANGKVPSAQLPSYVDDVLEYASTSAFPQTGESGKIYIALDTNKTYRWGGSAYVEISESLALGETDSTAYAGNKGKQNADNISAIQSLIPSSATTSNKLATANDIPDISGKADKSEMSVSTSNDLTTIQLKSGTSATVINAHQDISGKADKSEMSVSTSGDKTTIQLKSGTSAEVLNQHQDISGKVDKVQGKGLSTNDYDNTAKGIVDGVTSALADKVDKVNGKGLSTEDYTAADKTKLSGISDNATKTASSTTNGHIEIDDVDTTVYDDTAVTTAIENIEDELSTDYATVEGNPINFSTKSAQKSESTILSLEPIQDLHGYDKPWVGGAGKNKADFVDGYSIDGSGYVVAYTATNRCATVNPIPIVDGTTYKVAKYGNSSALFIYAVWNDNTLVRREANVTANSTLNTSGGNKLYVCAYDDTVANAKPMVVIDTIPDAYEPYENFCPITGRTQVGIEGCGKNHFVSKIKGNINNNGVIISDDNYYLGIARIVKGQTYIWSRNGIAEESGLILTGYFTSIPTVGSIAYNNARDTSGVNPFVAPISGYAVIRYNANASNLDKTQLELGNQATTFEPYQVSNNLTIQLGSTVYGAQIDLEKGELTITNKVRLLGDLTWQTGTDTTSQYFKTTTIDDLKQSTSSYVLPYAICENYAPAPSSNVQNGCFAIGANENHILYVRDTSIADETEFVMRNATVKICYELATPITINLTPHQIKLLKGVNNISTDGDKITLTYRDGSVATLGDLKSAVDNFDSKIDESKILTDTVTGDKYILVVTNGVLDIQQVSN